MFAGVETGAGVPATGGTLEKTIGVGVPTSGGLRGAGGMGGADEEEEAAVVVRGTAAIFGLAFGPGLGIVAGFPAHGPGTGAAGVPARFKGGAMADDAGVPAVAALTKGRHS